MKKIFTTVFFAILYCATTQVVSAQQHRHREPYTGYSTRDSLTKEGYTLIFINRDSTFDPQVKQRLIDAFFTVYPKEAARFNPQTLKKVIFIVDPGYEGVAATGGGRTSFNPKWFHAHPGDIDVVTHEVMHIVQNYPGGAGPGWITEGIADYVRYAFGVDNTGAGWTMPDYKEGQSYTNSYRITARFFVWLEQHVNKSIVDKIDAAMRSNTYTPELWKQITGKDLDELWAAYAANPAVELHY